MLIQTFPPRLMWRVMAIRAASICRLVTYAGSTAWMPQSPNATFGAALGVTAALRVVLLAVLHLRGINMSGLRRSRGLGGLRPEPPSRGGATVHHGRPVTVVHHGHSRSRRPRPGEPERCRRADAAAHARHGGRDLPWQIHLHADAAEGGLGLVEPVVDVARSVCSGTRPSR